MPPRRRPIVLGLILAVGATLAVAAYALIVRPGADRPGIAIGHEAPEIEGRTLDGGTFRLSDLRGHPVVVNFWGPSCPPCRNEFPLFKAKLAEHAADGLVIVGVLMKDPPEPARDFVAAFGATWPTVEDPTTAIRAAYRVVARPQTYFIDGDGIVRAIQVGETTAADFERLYARIAP